MLEDKLTKHRQIGAYPFHMPGHKRNTALLKERNFNVELPYGIDVTEIEGMDNLHAPEGILLEGMCKVARLYQAARTYYLVNGSSCGNLSAILACTHRGERVIVARNCHQSVYHALELGGLQPFYIEPEYYAESEVGIFKGIRREQVCQAMEACPTAKAVILTSPTYEGFLSEVGEIARLCHQKQLMLIVDEAHGAHFPFVTEEERSKGVISAVENGADLVVQSVHKTLPALTQTAVLHVSDRVFCDKKLVERLEHYLRIFQSSSPSYPLMAGIENSIQFCSQNRDLFVYHQKRMKLFYDRGSKLKCLKVLNPASLPFDHWKIVIMTNRAMIQEKETGVWYSLTGNQLSQWLRREYQIELEMASMYYVIAMTSICDTDEAIVRLSSALEEIDSFCEPVMENESRKRQGLYWHRQKENGMMPCEVTDRDYEWCSISKAIGKTSKWNISIYPPGIPFVVSGETFTQEICEQIELAVQMGLSVQGIQSGEGQESRVAVVLS